MMMRLLLAAAVAASLLCAQGKKGGGSRDNGMNNMQMGPQKRASKAEELVEKLKLSSDQKDEVQKILVAAYEESAPVRDQMDKGRVAIAGAMIEGKSQDEIKKMLDDYSAASVQMTTIEAKAFTKIYQSLKPNQQSKAAPAFELMAAVLEQPTRGGGGGGRGGRGERGR